jgi:hypothetical protein
MRPRLEGENGEKTLRISNLEVEPKGDRGAWDKENAPRMTRRATLERFRECAARWSLKSTGLHLTHYFPYGVGDSQREKP